MPGRACTEAALLVLPRLQPLFGLDRSTGAETWSAPPRPHLWAGRDGGKPAYLQLQGAFTPCLLLLLALPSPLHLQKYIPQPAQTSAWTAGDRQCALAVVPLQGS